MKVPTGSNHIFFGAEAAALRALPTAIPVHTYGQMLEKFLHA